MSSRASDGYRGHSRVHFPAFHERLSTKHYTNSPIITGELNEFVFLNLFETLEISPLLGSSLNPFGWIRSTIFRIS